MTQIDNNSRAPNSSGRGESRVEQIWHRLVEALAAIGTLLIVVLMVIICTDIVARNVFGGSLPMVSELGALLLVLIVALQLAAAVRADRLARTEIFTTPFARRFPRGEAALSVVFNLIGAALFAGIAWATIRILGKDYVAGEFIGVNGIATLQTWPFRALILVGFGVAAMEFVVRAFAAARRALEAT